MGRIMNNISDLTSLKSTSGPVRDRVDSDCTTLVVENDCNISYWN